MPVSLTMKRAEPDEHNLPKHNKGRDLGAGGDESRTGNGCALISILRPQMKGGCCNLEGKANQSLDNAAEQQRRRGLRIQLTTNGGETGSARHTIDQAEPEKGE